MIAPALRAARATSLAFAGFGIMFIASSASAHHSAAAYDQSKMVDMKGVVTQWNFSMPHSWLEIVVDEPGGEPVVWRFEAGSANDPRGGYTKDAIKDGDEVTVTISPMRNGRPFGLLRAVTFEDGHMLGSKTRAYGPPEAEAFERRDASEHGDE